MTPVRLEPAALRSRVKHSTTEPLRSLGKKVNFEKSADDNKNMINYPTCKELELITIHCLLVTFANSLDPDQDQQNISPYMDPTFWKIFF